MSEVRFYHLLRQNADQALPALLAKALETGKRVVIKTSDAKRVAAISTHLWTYDAHSFMPHGSAKDGRGADQPVWITDKDDVPNAARILICVDGAAAGDSGPFDLCCHVFDGRDDQAVTDARTQWKAYQESGDAALTYWQQGETGWEKKV